MNFDWFSENFKDQDWDGKLEQSLDKTYDYARVLNGNDSRKIKEFEDKSDEFMVLRSM